VTNDPHSQDYQLPGWAILNGNAVCTQQQTHSPTWWLTPRVGSRSALFYIHKVNGRTLAMTVMITVP